MKYSDELTLSFAELVARMCLSDIDYTDFHTSNVIYNPILKKCLLIDIDSIEFDARSKRPPRKRNDYYVQEFCLNFLEMYANIKGTTNDMIDDYYSNNKLRKYLSSDEFELFEYYNKTDPYGHKVYYLVIGSFLLNIMKKKKDLLKQIDPYKLQWFMDGLKDPSSVSLEELISHCRSNLSL